MKFSLFVTILFFIALFSDCKKEQIIIKTPNPIDTTAIHIIELEKSSVLKNGTIWEVPFIANYEFQTKARFNLSVENGNPNNGFKENAGIIDIPFAVGKYTVKMVVTLNDFNNSIPDGYYGMSAYDEGIGNFYPDTTRTDNFIEILYCDTIKNEVEGRFQVFMGKRGGPSTISGVPDSVFLTEGKFYLKLQ